MQIVMLKHTFHSQYQWFDRLVKQIKTIVVNSRAKGLSTTSRLIYGSRDINP